MAQKTKAELVAEIDAIYVNCGNECITTEAVNAFEKDKVDSYAGQVIDITKASLIAAIAASEIEIGTRYRITNATGGVIWVWGVDANVISANAVKEGTWDGSTLTAGSFGNYDLANDRYISGGTYTPTITTSGFDSALNISSMYSVQGDIMTSTHYIEVVNDGASTSGIVEIDPPAGITLSVADLDAVGVAMIKDLTNFSNVQLMFVKLSSGKIAVEIAFASAFGSFEITLSCQSKLA